MWILENLCNKRGYEPILFRPGEKERVHMQTSKFYIKELSSQVRQPRQFFFTGDFVKVLNFRYPARQDLDSSCPDLAGTEIDKNPQLSLGECTISVIPGLPRALPEINRNQCFSYGFHWYSSIPIFGYSFEPSPQLSHLSQM